MTSSPLRGDALIGAVYRLALHSRRHRSYSLATFADRILRAVGDNRFRIILNQKTMDIKALAVWEESAPTAVRGVLAPARGRKTGRPYVSEFIALDAKSARSLARDLQATLFDGETVRGITAFVEAAADAESETSVRFNAQAEAVSTAQH